MLPILRHGRIRSTFFKSATGTTLLTFRVSTQIHSKAKWPSDDFGEGTLGAVLSGRYGWFLGPFAEHVVSKVREGSL